MKIFQKKGFEKPQNIMFIYSLIFFRYILYPLDIDRTDTALSEYIESQAAALDGL